VENIDKVLERGEKIELLVDKTDKLNQQAFKFEKTSVQLKRNMWLRKAKLYFFMVLGIMVILFFIFLVGCGYSFQSC